MIEVVSGLDGAIDIEALSLSLKWAQPPVLTAAITGNITIGPFYAYADGIGVTALPTRLMSARDKAPGNSPRAGSTKMPLT